MENTPDAGTEAICRWQCSKPHKDGIWRTGLRLPQLTPASRDEALAAFQTPLAAGLPAPVLPPREGMPATTRFEIKDRMLTRDGVPFFPIGFVFGTDTRSLSQARAMGANAVHFDVGWDTMAPDGRLPTAAGNTLQATLDRLARWDMATFPLLTGHYVPAWFREEHPYVGNEPLGSDGNVTGAWFRYSLHYKPMRDSFAQFCRAICPLFTASPAVVGICTWNEPVYGGIWNRPDQFADYSVWGIQGFRQHLQTLYPSLEALNAAWGSAITAWDEVQPPKHPDDLGRKAWLDWMTYGQGAFAEFFQWERGVIHDAAPEALLVHKKVNNPLDSSACSSGTNWTLMTASEDLFGLNAYEGPNYFVTMSLARSIAADKPVIVYETNVMPPRAIARTPERIRRAFWSQIAGGLRGMFIFALIDEPEHGLLSDEAVLPENRPAYTEFMQTVNRFGPILALPDRPSRLAVIYSTTAVLQEPGGRNWPFVGLDAFSLLRLSQFDVDFLPEERCNEAWLQRYEVIVLPSYTLLDSAAITALEQFVTRGGKLIAFAHSLERDTLFEPQPGALSLLGLDTRSEAIGGRTQQDVYATDPRLEAFCPDEFAAVGVEKVSSIKESAAELIPGKGVTSTSTGVPLLNNGDGYPAAVLTRGGRVVYLAFESRYSDPLRCLMEGVVRGIFGLDQPVRCRLQHEIGSYGKAQVRVLEDTAARKRYMLLFNASRRRLEIHLETPWRVGAELMHETEVVDGTVALAPYQPYLFELGWSPDE